MESPGTAAGQELAFDNNTRLEWVDLPVQVRAGIEDLLGSAVVTAENQRGGFSPGMAARVRCTDGRRAFVKAAGQAVNPHTPGIYRTEANVMRQLPARVPAPAMRGSYDDGEWVALIFDEVPGSPPQQPWTSDELRLVLDALADMSRALTPCPIDDVAKASDELRADMLCYRELASAPPADLDPWERRHLDRLADLAASALDHLDGDTLVHLDIRADNVLFDAARAWFVDWPWACRGAVWIDSVMLLLDAANHGIDPDPIVAEHPLLTDVAPDHITAFIAGLCGYFALHSRRPAPQGLPTVRSFQRAKHVTTLEWVRRRTGWN
ncbi:phosphotransferase [Phytoactinopolyspora mesophila]|nr:phosphotransferase [Phytoactinopolyspora mesophila]